jgi:hypothetical protein
MNDQYRGKLGCLRSRKSGYDITLGTRCVHVLNTQQSVAMNV